MMLAAFSRRTCHSRLLSLRCLLTEASSSAPDNVHPSLQQAPQPSEGTQRMPAWWTDPGVDATKAYQIITNRFRIHGSQREENYRQMINRVKNPQDAKLALKILDEGRRARAILQQHGPFTFHTSQLFITTCVSTKAFDVALEALQRAHEIGLQFFRADAYYAVMKGAVLNQQLDVAIRVFETMKENGVRPGGKVVFNLIMGSIINGRRDLAEAYAEEFRFNGIKINKASEDWLSGVRTPEHGAPDASQEATGLPDQQQATVTATS